MPINTFISKDDIAFNVRLLKLSIVTAKKN
jgi:hypothetical protein